MPFVLYIMEPDKKGNKNIYFNLQSASLNTITNLQDIWSVKLNDDIRIDTLSNSFKNAKKYSPSVYQHFKQYKLLHRRIVHNKMLCKMGISETPNCLFCNETETIEHIYLKCPNVIQLWHQTEDWAKTFNIPHFKISKYEKIFGEKFNDHIKHVIVISVKDVIYQKRKKGDRMTLTDVKRCIQKNLHINQTQRAMKNDTSSFEKDWKPFIETFRTDPTTKNSWYLI